MDREDPNRSHFTFVLHGLKEAEKLGLQVKSVVPDDGEPRLVVYQQLGFSQAKGDWYLKDITKIGQPREAPLWGKFLEATEHRLALREEWSNRPNRNSVPKFAGLLFAGEGGKSITRRRDTPIWSSLGLEMRGYFPQHIADTCWQKTKSVKRQERRSSDSLPMRTCITSE